MTAYLLTHGLVSLVAGGVVPHAALPRQDEGAVLSSCDSLYDSLLTAYLAPRVVGLPVPPVDVGHRGPVRPDEAAFLGQVRQADVVSVHCPGSGQVGCK